MDISKILTKYYLNNSWCCGETYESLEWYDTTIVKPIQEELDLKYDELLLDEMREQRDKLLRECDHCALPDFPSRELWLTYRQELRDFQSIWVEGMEFPTKPE
jgi:hypothetical protein